MLTAGIVAEYNPFHNGHAAMINQLREQGMTHIAAVMSGNFVQRGEPALLDKFARAEQALRGGCDLVLELPCPWAVSGAERFAWGGVSALHALGCVDRLYFGSEAGRIEPLCEAAQWLESADFQQKLRRQLAEGLGFATARQMAWESNFAHDPLLLNQPNNILGIEYCKALNRLSSPMEPHTIARTGVGHDSLKPSGSIASAGWIRKQLRAKKPVTPYLPPASQKIIAERIQKGEAPAQTVCGERAILYRLRSLTQEQWSCLPDLSEGLEHRIAHAARVAQTLEELLDLAKTKRYSHARLRRIVLSAFLGITESEFKQPIEYIRVLGFRPAGIDLLRLAKKKAATPLLTNSSEIRSLPPRQKERFQIDSERSDLFALFLPKIGKCGEDRTHGPILISKG